MSGHKYNGYQDGHAYWQDSEGRSSDGPVPVVYEPPSEETTPLLPASAKTRRVISRNGFKSIACILLACIVSGILYLHVRNYASYPSDVEAIRRGWEKEVAQHDVVREEWRVENQEHATIVEEWKLQKEWYERDVARRIREEDKRQEQVRQEWAGELERHAREAEEYEKAVARRMQEEQERQEKVRKEWAQEVERYKREREEMERRENERQENERQRWLREVDEYEKAAARRMHEEHERQERVRKEWAEEVERQRHECEEMERRENQRQEKERQEWRREEEYHDRIEEERRKREEEERQKLNMFWGHVEAHTCTTYATREYTAQLMNLPAIWEHRVEACKITPLEVHGMSYLPKSCEDKGPGVVIGKWEINQHEPDCAPFWIWYKDKESPFFARGCTSPGSGQRRIEHYLENLSKGSDWREFCATTPVRFHGLEFSGAQQCTQINSGAFGYWEIDDADCQ